MIKKDKQTFCNEDTVSSGWIFGQKHFRKNPVTFWHSKLWNKAWLIRYVWSKINFNFDIVSRSLKVNRKKWRHHFSTYWQRYEHIHIHNSYNKLTCKTHGTTNLLHWPPYYRLSYHWLCKVPCTVFTTVKLSLHLPGLHRAGPAWQYKNLCERTEHNDNELKQCKFKKCALSCRSKLEVESADLRDLGREFQTVGLATQQALPNFVLVCGTL